MGKHQTVGEVTPDALLSLPIEISSISSEPSRHVIVANAVQRARIAQWLDAPSVESLTGEFEVSAVSGGVRVAGRLAAELGRICVITLEPMRETIDDAFVIRFLRHLDEALTEPDDSDDYVEELTGDVVDLGAVLVEQLSLSMSAHPKLPGAAVAAPQDLSEPSPFAALRGLANKHDDEV